jgi:hypothetical protein|uniref:Uncharacterized protein n=1 Tax=Zea mays TaxID=4577 RepID=C0PJZ4_MAIZE|nr:unknown [Zea mays]
MFSAPFLKESDRDNCILIVLSSSTSLNRGKNQKQVSRIYQIFLFNMKELSWYITIEQIGRFPFQSFTSFRS